VCCDSQRVIVLPSFPMPCSSRSLQ
jgi:hypothetical protein